MNKLIVANLLHRPLRSLISISAIAMEVVMMLIIVAIMMGQLTNQKQTNNGIGADLMVRPGNAMVFNAVNGAPIPIKLQNFLATVPHVTVAAAANQSLSMAGKLEIVMGVDYPNYSRLAPFNFVAGGPPQGPYEAIVDDIFATTGDGHHIGDTIVIQKHDFRISGIFAHGKGARKLIPLSTMGELRDEQGRCSVIYIKVDKPENINLVMEELKALPGMSNYQLMTMEEWYSLLSPDKVPGLTTTLHVVMGIAVIIGFLVIFQAMYTSVLERTREIGILKSMGASNGAIISVVLRETSLLALVGVLVGIAASFGVKFLLSHIYHDLFVDMNVEWIIQGAIIAFISSVLGAFYPAWMAARKDAIDALAYE